MIELPKTEVDPKDTEGLCKCRPICKSRRRMWRGELQQTSAELLLDRKPLAECIMKWPAKARPNAPCPLFAKSKKLLIRQRDSKDVPIIRICGAEIDDTVKTPYLKAAELARQNGALDFVQACCPFCMCGKCCDCGLRIYPMNDPERVNSRRADMREFDARVKQTYKDMRIMYD
ncbi:hypothetical protein NE865_00012 [Phthorimaea operculella]|nr:hypothetical protein NE865_00012 [Phthorimaea operculella]